MSLHINNTASDFLFDEVKANSYLRNSIFRNDESVRTYLVEKSNNRDYIVHKHPYNKLYPKHRKRIFSLSYKLHDNLQFFIKKPFDTEQKIFYTITKPRTTKPKSIVIHVKGRGWDLGSFHRCFCQASQNKGKILNTTLAELFAETTQSIVYCIEYPGYGVDHPKKRNTIISLVSLSKLIEHICDIYQSPDIKIMIIGYSLGCAIASSTMYFMNHTRSPYYSRINGIIMISPFSHILDTMGDNSITRTIQLIFARIFMRKSYRKILSNEFVIHGISDVPIGIIHGNNDGLCPISNAYNNIYSNCNQAGFIILPSADHYNLFSHPDFSSSLKTIVKNILFQ